MNDQSFTERHALSRPCDDKAQSLVQVCLLGSFLLLKAGQPVVLRNGGKTKALLTQLGLQPSHRIPRETLLQMLWPDNDPALSSQSLHSLVYGFHKLVGDSLRGAAPVYHDEGCYRLNIEAGIRVDVACFDALVKAGDQRARTGDLATASDAYRGAVELYRGDLCVDGDVNSLMERERLRARYLTLLAYLANYHYNASDYTAALDYAWRLLVRDPCREDAHRLIMRSYVRQGERAEALHQYHVCVNTLRVEFDSAPETATTILFEQIRRDPGSV
jgi:DNA-binding SARP family transcriptional activator